MNDMGIRPNLSTKNPGRTYRHLDTKQFTPVFPFGWGLSFTSWELSFAQVPQPLSVAPGEDSQWVVSLKNTGQRVGGMAVICYVGVTKQSPSVVVKTPPIRAVFDFARVEGLAPGATRLLSASPNRAISLSRPYIHIYMSLQSPPTQTCAVSCSFLV